MVEHVTLSVLKYIMVLMEVIKMNGKIKSVVWILFPFVTVSYGQQLPHLKEVNLECSVVQDQTAKMFYYAYSVFNGHMNTGNIIKFQIDISKGPDAVVYDTVGLKFENDSYTEGAFRRHYPGVAGRIIPVGFPSAPGIWIANLSDALTAAFSGDSRMLAC